MIANSDFAGGFDFMLYQEYSVDGQHHFENFMSGDWAWKQAVSYFWNLWIHLLIKGSQDKIIITHPENKGAFFVPVILGSDKMTVSITTGQTKYWLVYISIGNICNNMQCAHHNGIMLLGFLACPKCKFLFIFSIAHTYLNTFYKWQYLQTSASFSTNCCILPLQKCLSLLNWEWLLLKSFTVEMTTSIELCMGLAYI